MEVGLYGKLPSHGDFLRRRLADEIVGAWDSWLQSSLAASRRILGERWLDIYLTSPAWRFVSEPGACGPAPLAGVMVPSVDRVGRYFPLALMWHPPDELNPLTVATSCQGWFEAAERHLIETLSQAEISFESFDAGVISLGTMLDGLCTPPSAALDALDAEAVSGGQSDSWHVPLGDPPQLGMALQQLLYHRLRIAHSPLMLWWTEGSSMIQPSGLLTAGLPDSNAFAAFLVGSWAEHGWRDVGAKLLAAQPIVDTISDEPIIHYSSAGLSDRGRVRHSNQDAFLERPEIGLWVVADGMGGHAAGDVASRMVCDVLADLTPADTLQQTVELVRERLAAVNEHLRAPARRSVGDIRCGSTVVVLLTRKAQCVILWAGDSRAYRLRAGQLELLTRDHVWSNRIVEDASEVASAPMTEFAVTRAVGGEDTLDLEIRRDHVCKGDRFLLCSDGLTREVDDARIEACLKSGETGVCAAQLLQASLDTGGHDNVTVIAIDAG